MNIDLVRQKLSRTDQIRWDNAITRNNVTQAAAILVGAGFTNDAIEYCLQSGENTIAMDIAIQARQFDEAENLAKMSGNDLKLAEILVLKGDLEAAARLFTRLQQFERAAKLYVQLKMFEEAAVLYIKIDQFMNAVMCYQKAGNTQKQLDTQIHAFEKELALVNGDISAVTVSRTMAVYAAKTLLESTDTVERGLNVLEKAQALESVAAELYAAEKFKQAGYCYERLNRFEEAYDAYRLAGDLSRALLMTQELHDDSREIDTLRHFQMYFKLGQKFIALKKYDEALATLKHINPDDSNYSFALELQGDIYCKLKNYADAVLCYESLFWTSMPNDRICRVAYKAGYCYEAIGDLENALKNYQKIYAIDTAFHDIGDIIKTVSERIQLATDRQNTGRAQDEYILSPGGTGKSRLSPSRGIMRMDTPRASSRTHISTIMVGNHEMPTIGNDRYAIVEEVAHGGMGIIYKATDTILMRTVALKVLSSKLKDNEVALEYFMREARASAALQHINIVTIYDIGSLNDGTIYLAMEYVEGKNLKQLVTQTGAFPTKFLVQIAIHACRGLQYAHDNGIIHRDVKSSNMMLAKKDKTLKILDMGLAKVVTAEDKNSTQAIGTPYYMSPEQVLGTTIDCRSDIYSLGVTLYECATGVLPFVKGDLPYKHVHEPPPPLRSFNEQVNPQLEEIILRMMEKNPEDRYPSCNDCISALKSIPFAE